MSGRLVCVLCLSFLGLPPSMALAGPACDVKIMAHARGVVSKNRCDQSDVRSAVCAPGTTSYTTQTGFGTYLLYILMPQTSSVVEGARFGIEYGPNVVIDTWNPCQDFCLEYSTTDWPASGAGTMLVGGDCFTPPSAVVAGYFEMSVYADDRFDLVGHPADGKVTVVECDLVETVLPASAAGAVGFGTMAGENPCADMPVDGDGDGVGDAEEDGGPNGGDGNADGLPDSGQGHVASIESATGGGYVTLIAPAANPLGCVVAWDPALDEAPGNPHPPSLAFPCGTVSFEVQGMTAGAAVDVILKLPPGCCTTNGYYRFGPRPGAEHVSWYLFPWSGFSGPGAEFDCTNDRIVLHLIDGKTGDDDIKQNGVIVDAGGPCQLATAGLGGGATGGGPGPRLAQSRPNPFASSTRIAFHLPARGPVTLRIFDLAGREVAVPLRAVREAGSHEIAWDGRGSDGTPLPAGIYLYRLETPAGAVSRKLLIAR